MAQQKSNIQQLPLHKALDEIRQDAIFRLEGENNISVTYLAGRPGGGKTACIREMAKTMGWGQITMNISMECVERFGGIPDMVRCDMEDGCGNMERNKLLTEWSVPEVIAQLRKSASNNKCVICLLDDWHLASSQIQQLGFELFTDYSIRGHKIPRNVIFALAGNESSLAGAKSQFSAVMNRVAKIHVVTDFDYWINKFAIPNNVHPAVLSFLDMREYRPFFHGDEDVINPWPSPRSWTNYSTKLKYKEQSGEISKLSEFEQLVVCSSFVGIKAANEFTNYYKIYSCFNTEEIFRTGEFIIPKKDVDKFAFSSAVSSKFYDLYLKNQENSTALNHYMLTYGKIIAELHKSTPEISIAAIKYIAVRDKKCLVNLIKKKGISTDIISELQKTSEMLG
jgi:hypothetical protein